MIEVTIQATTKEVEKEEYKVGVQVTRFSHPGNLNPGNNISTVTLQLIKRYLSSGYSMPGTEASAVFYSMLMTVL